MPNQKVAHVARVLVQPNDVLRKNTVSAAALKMRDCVHDDFTPFTIHFEGPTYWMYLDRKNLVTTGYGNLIDSTTDALGLPWELLHNPGTAATPDQIVAEWNMVKERTDMSPKGGGTFAAITTLRLTQAAVQALVERRLATNDGIMAKTFPDYPTWPADAQLEQQTVRFTGDYAA
jgi:hypothetical protein